MNRHQPGFNEIKLGDAITFQRGFDITKSEQTKGEVPIVSSSGISSFHNQWRTKGPGIVIGRKGTLGTVHFLKSNYWPHDTTLWVKDFKGNDRRFIYYFLQTLRLENFDTGSSNPTLNRNHIHKIRIVFPKLSIQAKIAAILSAYDDLIENNQRRIALLEKMAEEIYREWFVRLRFPGHKHVEKFKRAPIGWREAKLGDLIPERGLQTGKRPIGGAQDSGIPSIGAENVISLARHDFSKEKYVNEHFFDSMRQGHIADKDVLFYKDGAEIGRVTLVQDGFPHEKCCVNEHVFVIRTRDLAAQYFLYFYLNQEIIQEYVKTINKNAAQPGINKSELRSIPILLPHSGLIQEFENVVSPIIRQIFQLAKTQRTLTKTRDLLLPRLISGKLSVEHLDIRFPPSMEEVSQ